MTPDLAHPDRVLPVGDTVDVRRAGDFRIGHFASAVSCPLGELPGRLHLLPDRREPLWVFGDDEELESALRLLHERGLATACPHPATASFASPREAVGAPWVGGAERVRLWRPTGFLARVWEELAPELTAAAAGRGADAPLALDLACGSGRDAVWLSLSGCRVVGFDMLPDALARGRERAERARAALRALPVPPEVRFTPPAWVRVDLEAGLPARPESADLVLCARFLHRPLVRLAAAALSRRGSLVLTTFTERQRAFGRPTHPDHLLEEGELLRLVEAAGLAVRASEETAPPGGPALAAVWAVRPAS